MLNREELVNTAILTRLSYFHLNAMVGLYRTLGSATAIMEQRKNLGSIFPGLPKRVLADINDMASTRDRAEEELAWADDHGVKALCLNDDGYPDRMKEAPDAPLMLFYKGTANLNARHIINIVGTRHCTRYGEDLIRAFVRDLHAMVPDTIVVSGLAYGVDIHAHREALANGMDTVAVLAHGLDYLYPQRHKETAKEMLSHGGLLTEFFTNTNADKMNFIRRNRIVAGMADATILVESASHGGGLVTARIANSYNREVLAFPGRVTDEYSAGCNHLIRDNKAALINNADDFVQAMGWQCDSLLNEARKQGIERELFPNLTPEEQSVVNTLSVHNDLPVGMLSVQTNIPISQLTALLFQLEMKGVVKIQAGGVYHLLKTN